VLRHLYPRGAGEKVLVFTDMKSQGQFLWEADRSDDIQQRHLPAGNDGVWFSAATRCPVNFYRIHASTGNCPGGPEEAITAWRYAVLESDEADADDWLRCLCKCLFASPQSASPAVGQFMRWCNWTRRARRNGSADAARQTDADHPRR